MRMLIEQMAGRVYNTPLLITPEKLWAIMGVLSRGADIDLAFNPSGKLAASAMAPSAREPRDGGGCIAVVPVIGSLVARSSGFGGGSGLRSYASIKSELKALAADKSIDAIMLDIDSHGGEVSGCFSTADLIREIDSIKPVWGHINESGYSAGYALASACSRLFATPTSGGLSIGVVMQHINQEKLDQKEGREVTFLYSGKHKIDGNMHQPLSDAFKKQMQEKIDTLRGMFAAKVDAFRGLKAGTSLATEAGVLMGEEIVKAGFADAIATWEEALEELGAKINHKKGGGKMSMSTKERMAALIENNADAESALADLGFTKAAAPVITGKTDEEVLAAVNEAVVAATTAATDAAFAQCGQIATMCELAGIPQMIGPMVLQRHGVEEAREAILNEKAVIDGKSTINAAISGENTPPNDFLAYMQRRVAAQA